MNSRLDEMQAAILRARLPLAAALDARTARARGAIPPALADAAGHRAAATRSRTRVSPVPDPQPRSRGAAGAPEGRGVETLIHYPVPIPRQPALASENPAVCPVADRICGEILSLPLRPGLTRQAIDAVAVALHEFHAAV